MTAEVVRLRSGALEDDRVAELTAQARTVSDRLGAIGRVPDVDGAIELATTLGRRLPLPARGETLVLWEALAGLGAVDLTVARVVEPHLDALAILKESEREGRLVEQTWPDDTLWGVYAAEGPAGRLRAAPTDDGGWRLDGPKPWCSLADRVGHALVTAWVDDERRGLFVVDLDDPGVRLRHEQGGWVSRGLAQVRSTGLELVDVEAVAVGEPGWYLRRPGFAWGGVGVAAIWYGGAVALARRLREAAARREPDQVALVHLGAVDTALARARAVLVDTAAVADAADSPADPSLSDGAVELAAARARQVVADTVEEVIGRVARALGPAPLTGDEEHARRVADLTVYVRQHHGERDLARLGGHVLRGADASVEGRPDGAWAWW